MSTATFELPSFVLELTKNEPQNTEIPIPPVPRSLAETGLSQSLFEQLVLKILHFRGEMVGRDLASAVGVPFQIVEPIIDGLKWQHLIAVKRAMSVGSISSTFTLSESGRTAARDALALNQYAGVAPVPLAQYVEMVAKQRRMTNWLTATGLKNAYKHLVVRENFITIIGPAVNAGKSFLIYGQPGNGKTALAEALGTIEGHPIFIPHAIECQGNIIQMYDPIYHHKIEEQVDRQVAIAVEPKFDSRWFRSPRPFITSGGELTLEMLDLTYSESSRIYEAPFQLKANNGIYLIDDFGRQRATPAEVLNRWIVPMERSVDFLNFLTGGKMTVPFETFVVFSTNLRPEQLGDEAFLRRIQYKLLMRSPDRPEFNEIFEREIARRKLPCQPADILARLVDQRYRADKRQFRRCHARDLLNRAEDMIRFERRDRVLTEEILNVAYDACFVNEEGWAEELAVSHG